MIVFKGAWSVLCIVAVCFGVDERARCVVGRWEAGYEGTVLDIVVRLFLNLKADSLLILMHSGG